MNIEIVISMIQNFQQPSHLSNCSAIKSKQKYNSCWRIIFSVSNIRILRRKSWKNKLYWYNVHLFIFFWILQSMIYQKKYNSFRIERFVSRKIRVQWGVPQGSRLGHLLLMYLLMMFVRVSFYYSSDGFFEDFIKSSWGHFSDLKLSYKFVRVNFYYCSDGLKFFWRFH